MKDNFRPSAAQPNPPTEERVDSSLTSLLEQHQREIWEWKQKEHQWIRDKNLLDGNKKIIEELSTKLIEMQRKEIYELKKYKAEVIKLENLLHGYKKVIEDISKSGSKK